MAMSPVPVVNDIAELLLVTARVVVWVPVLLLVLTVTVSVLVVVVLR